jgi:hypothetical protein
MADIPPIADIVAEREILFVKESGEEQTIVVRLGKPYAVDADSWRCPYEIIGPARTRRFGMVGVDSMQALLLSTQVIESELAAWARREKGTFFWNTDTDTGFPNYVKKGTKY